MAAGTTYCPNCGARQAVEGASTPAPVLQFGRLTAEYSAVKAPSGEWFALGSLYLEAIPNVIPATILVGTGVSPEGALADLRQELEREAGRLTLTTL
jgi:hypothetical protein